MEYHFAVDKIDFPRIWKVKIEGMEHTEEFNNSLCKLDLCFDTVFIRYTSMALLFWNLTLKENSV